MFVANKGTEDEWSCECCDPNGYHHHHDDTCEHVCCGAWAGDEIDNPPHDQKTCSDLMGALQDSLAPRCICMTAADLGFSGWGDGVNPNLIANRHPECPVHGQKESDDT